MGLSGVPCAVGQSRSRKCTRSDSPNQHKADECPTETSFDQEVTVYMLFVYFILNDLFLVSASRLNRTRIITENNYFG